MSSSVSRRPAIADALFELLDPIPFGCFVAALIFDVVYARSGEMMWTKAAAWLIVLGLAAAIVPRLIDLAQVALARRGHVPTAARIDFWLHLFAILAAIVNAFVHSRDAYAVVPEGQWLSALTVALMGIGRLLRPAARVEGHRHG